MPRRKYWGKFNKHQRDVDFLESIREDDREGDDPSQPVSSPPVPASPALVVESPVAEALSYLPPPMPPPHWSTPLNHDPPILNNIAPPQVQIPLDRFRQDALDSRTMGMCPFYPPGASAPIPIVSRPSSSYSGGSVASYTADPETSYFPRPDTSYKGTRSPLYANGPGPSHVDGKGPWFEDELGPYIADTPGPRSAFEPAGTKKVKTQNPRNPVLKTPPIFGSGAKNAAVHPGNYTDGSYRSPPSYSEATIGHQLDKKIAFRQAPAPDVNSGTGMLIQVRGASSSGSSSKSSSYLRYPFGPPIMATREGTSLFKSSLSAGKPQFGGPLAGDNLPLDLTMSASKQDIRFKPDVK